MTTKRLVHFFLMITVMFAFFSCNDDDNDLIKGKNKQKGVHKIEVTVTSQDDDITTALVFSGIGKDGINANAPLYNESGEKCGDGTYTRSIKNGVGKYICYTNNDATGLMCVAGVSLPKVGSSAIIVCIGYIDNKEVSRMERTVTSEDYGNISIQTFSQD